jgi:hypothetical protein
MSVTEISTKLSTADVVGSLEAAAAADPKAFYRQGGRQKVISLRDELQSFITRLEKLNRG